MNWNNIVESWKSFSLLKKFGLGFLGMVIFIVLFTVLAYLKMSFGYGRGYSGQAAMIMPMSPNMVTMSGKSSSMAMPTLSYGSFESSARDNFTISYGGSAVPSEKAELFEMTSYSATIETGDVDQDCKVIENLKADDSIIFLSANKGKTSCSFSFKVKKSSAQKALDAIKSLDPEQFNESTHTVEDVLTNYDRRKEILEDKLTTVNAILADAVSSYEAVSKLAVQTGSVTNLRQAINDKIDIVERLTQKKLSIEQELASISNSSSSDRDETTYAQFSVSIYKSAYIDGEALANSWKNETKRLVNEMNYALQGVTIGFLMILMVAFKYILYFMVAVIIIKYLKKFIVSIWNKE